MTISTLLDFIHEPEWSNYLQYRRRRNPLSPLFIPLELAVRGSWWLLQRVLLTAGWRLFRRGRFHLRRSPIQESSVEVGADAVKFAPVSIAGRQPVHVFSQDDVSPIVAYAKTHLLSEVESLISKASKILNGVFPLVSGAEFNFRQRIPWAGPFSDQEILFYLNRWYHGVTLAKAFVYTESEQYAQRFTELLKHWSTENPQNARSPVWESYSVGERIVNWLFAHHLFQKSAVYQEQGASRLLQLLAGHARYLAEHLEDRVVHNHLINNGRALFAYGVLCPELSRAAEFRVVGWDILVRELRRQFRSDGMLGEQSSHYHLLLLSRYAEVCRLAERNGFAVPYEMLAALRQMFRIGNLFVRPDGTLVLIGDVSPDADPADLAGVLSVGSAFFATPSRVPPNEHALWCLAAEGLDRFALQSAPPGLIRLSDSGHVVWGTSDIHFVMRCDPRAEVIRHGHQDVLGFDLWVRGRPLLIDSGNASFNRDWRGRHFRSSHAHNAIVVDSLPPYVNSATMRRLMSTDYYRANASFAECACRGRQLTVEAWHTGYQRLSSPVVVRRRIQLGADSLSVSDVVEGSSQHPVEILFQFGLNGVEVGIDGRTLQVYEPGGTRVAVAKFTSTAHLSISVRKGQRGSRVGGWYSPSYGVLQESTTVVCSFRSLGSTQINSLMLLQ